MVLQKLEKFWIGKDRNKRGYKQARKPKRVFSAQEVLEPDGFEKEKHNAIPKKMRDLARRELKMALSLKDIRFLKDVPPELLKDFKAMAAKQDTNFIKTTVQYKMESMFRKLKDNDYLGVDATTFSVCEDIEEINLVSTKFPKPVLNPDGLYNTPEEVDEQEIIALNKKVYINSLKMIF